MLMPPHPLFHLGRYSTSDPEPCRRNAISGCDVTNRSGQPIRSALLFSSVGKKITGGGQVSPSRWCVALQSLGPRLSVSWCAALRSSYTMRMKCAVSDAFVRDCVFAYCASVAQYVFSLSAEHCFRLRNNAISDERVRDCALSTHSVFRPLQSLFHFRALVSRSAGMLPVPCFIDPAFLESSKCALYFLGNQLRCFAVFWFARTIQKYFCPCVDIPNSYMVKIHVMVPLVNGYTDVWMEKSPI